MKYNQIFFILISALLYACQPTVSHTKAQNGNHYATGFRIEQRDSIIHLTVFYPWKRSEVMAEYTVRQPYKRLASNSCTHVGFLSELGQLHRLIGITNPELVYTPIHAVLDLGDAMNPNTERVLLAQPDAILLSTYSEADPVLAQLQALNLPIVFINEWMETTPLGRAEWLRFVGALTGCLPQADSLFQSVCESYEQLCASATDCSILSGQDFRGTWYVPAGGTYMGCLFRDAGFRYHYADDPRETSIPLTTEQAIRTFKDAEVWVGVNARSLEELAQQDEKHTWLKAYQDGRIYHFAARSTPSGGNDFWESGLVHPERILTDLRHILTNEVDSLYYAGRVE